MKHLKLNTKFLFPILIGTILVLLVGTMLVISRVKDSTSRQMELSRQSLTTEQNSGSKGQIEALHSKADTLGLFMSMTAPDLIIAYDFTSLGNYQSYASRDPDVAYAVYQKPDGKSMLKFIMPNDKSDIIEKRYKITSEGDLIGYVLLGMTKKHVTKSITASNDRIENAISKLEAITNKGLTEFIAIMIIGSVMLLGFIVLVVYIQFRLLVVNRLNQTRDLITQIAAGHGDLTQRLPTPNFDEISDMCTAINVFIQQLQEMIGSIAKVVQTLNTESSQVSQFSEELSASMNTQRLETIQTASAMNQMTATVQEVSRNASNAADAASSADNEASGGKQIVNNTISSINALANEVNNAADVIHQLEKDSENIGGVIDVIQNIAEQTNLLALNAAIEAARAGEQGRGFAVVADEVRTLASRTKESTSEIQAMIEQLQNGSSHAVSVMQQSNIKAQETVEQASRAGISLEKIASSISMINDMNTQIATSAEEQTLVAEEINKSVDSINNISDSAANNAQLTAQSSNSLSNLAEQLRKLVLQFKI